MASKTVPAWREALRRWAYYKSYFPQLGLMRDDTLHETPAVAEAIRRLPKDIQGERSFRISRAFLLSTQKAILPKEEWTKYEEDVHYLKPYLEQVEKELAEKSEWSKK